MAISQSEFINIMGEAFGKDPYSLSEFKCPKCGKPIRLNKVYYLNGNRRRWGATRMVCTDMVNSHWWKYQDFLIWYCDVIEGMTQALEYSPEYSDKSFI